MRRRFGRKRGGDGRAPIDAGNAFARIVEAGLVPAAELTPFTLEGVPEAFAALGSAEIDGRPALVAFSPRSGADALLAALAAGGERLAEGGTAYAVAPSFAAGARRILGLAAPRAFQLETREAASLGSGGAAEAEVLDEILVLPPTRVASRISDRAEHELFVRAAQGLAGLAAKHGGSVRGAGSAVELILLARRVAALRADLVLDAFVPRRSSDRLHDVDLADVLDRLEGQLRKHLNDRKARDGEEGLRAGAIDASAATAQLRSVVRWPLPGSDPEVLDFLGIDPNGHPVAGAIRKRLSIDTLGAVVDSVLALRAALPALLAGEAPPVRLETPKLLLVADRFDDAALKALAELSLAVDRLPLGGAAPETVSEGRVPGGQRRRRRRRGGRSDREATAAVPSDGPEEVETREEKPAPVEATPRFAELTAFDLADEGGADERPRRGRRRGRRRRGGQGEGGAQVAGEEDAEPERDAERPRGRGRGRGRSREPAAEAEAEKTEDRAGLEDRVEVASVEDVVARDDEADAEADAEAEAAVAPPVDVPEVEEPPLLERPRRAAIVAHADRESIAAAALLAREVRTLEGLWIYPQDELMTFFRSVATDLRDDVPIIVIGFTASPARDVLQAVSLYSGRLAWFDHHEWPPEDLGALRELLSEEVVNVEPGLDTPLPMVVRTCTRRSRFSDKLVDLAAARFSEHDFTRWGRVWWSRLGDLAGQSGDRRSAIEGLLAGRPSDLARQAARVEPPAYPPEVAWVSDRDFVLEHFAGYTMVLVPVEPGLQLHMAARIARERAGAELSLAWHEGGDLMALGGNDRLDLTSMAAHLANKQEWIEALPTDDHVARFRVRQLSEHVHDVVAEIAMGRSILEG